MDRHSQLHCRFAVAVLGLAASKACADPPQSALHPAGREAEVVADLFWWMAGAGFVIWALVVALAIYVSLPGRRSFSPRKTRWLILYGGAVLPTLLLAILLIYSLSLLPRLRDDADVDLRIAVSGERWWWRVRYPQPDGEGWLELANEIRLPVGQRVEFVLSSPDVIHSFWIPALGGKVDMIPGRTTYLFLEAQRPGVFRGACAEYCGSSHAFMNFDVVAMPPAEFEQWLAAQAQPAAEPDSELTRRGRSAFLANGCGACHRVRGTQADGALGPDLTHVASRLSLGAGLLPTETETFRHWLQETEALKPGVRMPAFGVLPEEQLSAIAAYLSSLE